MSGRPPWGVGDRPATTFARMNLGGPWRVAESSEDLRRRMADPALDDAAWPELEVPGHWRWVPELAGSDGPVLYRRRFDAPPPEPGERAFLVFDGIFYQGDVWLDGEYLGDTEGYFAPHRFEITDALRSGPDHVLAVEVSCSRPSDLTAKRNLTGVFQHWDCIDPDWNPGGIWAGVRIERTGPVRLAALKVLCREANAERAVLEIEGRLDSPEPGPVHLATTVRRHPGTGTGTGTATGTGAEVVVGHGQEEVLSAGANVVRWRVAVERPDLWWPRALGAQPLYQVEVEVSAGGRVSDRTSVVTGLRQIKFRNFVATVNGERLFLKGANYGPTRRDLAGPSAADVERDVRLAADAGLDLIRVHGHIGRPELYETADRLGMLIWQDMPLQWGYGNVRRQAVAQARAAVDLLGHHPSIALWCGHNEPVAVEMAPGTALETRTVVRVAAAQVLPTWNKTGLDRSIRRALERADGTRTVVAHSGVVPHPAWGTDSHLYFGWYHGDERDLPATLARFPVLARFVSEFGAQAVPDSDGFMDPAAWPDLDWEALEAHHGLQRAVFDERMPPAGYPTFDGWRRATQTYQADLLRHHIEALRRLKYRPTGGFCMFMLADAQPAVSWAVLDHERAPKAGYRAVQEACAPVIVTADRPAARYRPGDRVGLDVHVVSDLRTPIAGATVTVEVSWPDGRRRWAFGGDVGADECARVGRIEFDLARDARQGAVRVDLALEWPGGAVTNGYDSRIEP